MTVIDLSYPNLVAEVTAIVAEKGKGYVYGMDPETLEKRVQRDAEGTDDCFYAGPGGKPGCIIGHLIHKLKPEENLDRLDGWGAGGAMRGAGLPVKGKELSFLNQLQRHQDAGQTWGNALNMAKEFAEKVTV